MDATPASPLVCLFERHLRAANRAPPTVATYLHAVRQAHGFLQARGTTLEAASRADLEVFMADLLGRRAPATAATYRKVLKILYAWLVEEGEVAADPTVRMRPPIVPDKPVPIVPDDGLKRLFQACAGNGFEAVDEQVIDAGQVTGLKASKLSLIASQSLLTVDFDTVAPVQRRGEQLGQVQRPAAEQVVELGAAGEPVGQHHCVRARGAHGR